MTTQHETKWSPERLLYELAQLVRSLAHPETVTPENNKRLAEWGAQFQKAHPNVAKEISKELEDKAKAEEAAKADAAAAARGETPAPKKNEGQAAQQTGARQGPRHSGD